jgi:hypothetical protein
MSLIGTGTVDTDVCAGMAPASEGGKPEPSQKVADDSLFLALKARARAALGTWEHSIQVELEHIGRVLDKRIAVSQRSLHDAMSRNSQENQIEFAWDTFRLLRKRRSFFVPSLPCPLLVPPSPVACAL